MRPKHGSLRRLIKGIASSPETVEGSQAFDWWIGIGISVDFGPEIAELIIERFLAHLDPPGFRTAVASMRPAIASRLQMILHVEGTVLGKDRDTRPLACFVEFRERGGSRSVSLSGGDLQEGETIIKSPVTIMEIARLPDQVSELGAFISPQRPVDSELEQAQALPDRKGHTSCSRNCESRSPPARPVKKGCRRRASIATTTPGPGTDNPRRAGPFLTFKSHHLDSVIIMGGKEIQALPL